MFFRHCTDTERSWCRAPLTDRFVGAKSAVPPLGPFLRSQQAHAVHCMSPSPVNDDPRSRVGMGAALKGMIVPTVRPKPDRSGTQLAAGTGCDLYRPCHDDGQHLATNIGDIVLAASGRLQGFVVLLASLFQLLSIYPARIIFEMSFDAVPHKSRCMNVVKRTAGIFMGAPCPTMPQSIRSQSWIPLN